MPTCPRCNVPTDYLVEGELVVEYFELRLVDGESKYSKSLGINESIGDAPFYTCPNCLVEICEGQDKAIAFLKGEA